MPGGHNNPVSAGLCNFAEYYHYSSASFYKKASDKWPFLTHCNMQIFQSGKTEKYKLIITKMNVLQKFF